MDDQVFALAADQFATLMGLIQIFKHETASSGSKKKFKDWASERGFTEVLEQLNLNQDSLDDISYQIEIKHDELMSEIRKLSMVVSSFTSGLQNLGTIQTQISPTSIKLSTQQKIILHQLYEMNMNITITSSHSGTLLEYSDHSGRCSMPPTDPRYLVDDVKKLSELGLLRISGDEFATELQHTRAGQSFWSQNKPI